MDTEVFKDEEFSKVYQEKMFPLSKKVTNLIIGFLEDKKGRPFDLAVDAGCGTGRSTRPLAEHFCKVIGIDISESQINEAKRFTPQENITYQVSPVEKMPLEDASVDLVNSNAAAHWFPIDQFIPEVTRVLKNRGCLALHCLYPKFTIQYKNCSGTLTNIFNEVRVDFV
ncbi:putative methyltransferase DDB_G0268948 [Pseudophryne corroboree]|uniref:putative methyltransferase DDB_G0268948 n=1 Tax=Pseudophryne corroboree TaxID=495146 RepID=UPI0030816D2A